MSGCCIKIKGVPTVAKATCELELTLSSRKSFEKRNKLTYSSDHLLLYWTAGVVKNVSKGANESFSLLILSSVDIRFEKTVALMPEKKWLTNSPALDPQPYWIEFPTLMDRLLAFKTWKKNHQRLRFLPRVKRKRLIKRLLAFLSKNVYRPQKGRGQ